MNSASVVVYSLLGVALAAGCTSSSPAGPSPVVDASAESSATPCTVMLTPGCKQGETCCGSVGASTIGTCTAPTECHSDLQVACLTAYNCDVGQVCCAQTTLIDAGADAAPTLGPPRANIAVFCANSCAEGQLQLCIGNAECTAGRTCQVSPVASYCLPPPDSGAAETRGSMRGSGRRRQHGDEADDAAAADAAVDADADVDQ